MRYFEPLEIFGGSKFKMQFQPSKLISQLTYALDYMPHADCYIESANIARYELFADVLARQLRAIFCKHASHINSPLAPTVIECVRGDVIKARFYVLVG